MEKRIIVNADDFGLSEGVNKAVETAHSTGILTSATLMANMPAAENAVEIAKKFPNLGVGVHLNLFEGSPLSKDESITSLVNPQGGFKYSPSSLSLKSLISHKIRKAIKAEFSAQIQWVIDHGIRPTHLDSHKHIHCFPAIFPIVCSLAKKFNIPAIRWAFEPKQVSKMPWPLLSQDGRKRARIIRFMSQINKLQNSRYFKNRALLGIAHTGRIDLSFFKAAANYCPVYLIEIMTHPGYPDGLDPGKTRLIKERKVELDVLCNEKTRKFFKDAGIKLINYGNI